MMMLELSFAAREFEQKQTNKDSRKSFYVNLISILCYFHVDFKLKDFPESVTIFFNKDLNEKMQYCWGMTSLIFQMCNNVKLMTSTFHFLFPNFQ